MRETGGILLGILAITVCCGSHLLLAGGVAGPAGLWLGDGLVQLGVAAVLGIVLFGVLLRRRSVRRGCDVVRELHVSMGQDPKESKDTASLFLPPLLRPGFSCDIRKRG